MVVPLDVAQMRLMLSMGLPNWSKDLQLRRSPLHGSFALLNFLDQNKEPRLSKGPPWFCVICSHDHDLTVSALPKILWFHQAGHVAIRPTAFCSRPSKNRDMPGFSLRSVCCVEIAQALEGLVVSAADMAVAKSMHPATARKPIIQDQCPKHHSPS